MHKVEFFVERDTLWNCLTRVPLCMPRLCQALWVAQVYVHLRPRTSETPRMVFRVPNTHMNARSATPVIPPFHPFPQQANDPALIVGTAVVPPVTKCRRERWEAELTSSISCLNLTCVTVPYTRRWGNDIDVSFFAKQRVEYPHEP